MLRFSPFMLLGALIAMLPISVGGQDFDAVVPIEERGFASYYVSGSIEGAGTMEFMVDTGSSLTTVTEAVLKKLLQGDQAKFSRHLTGTLVDGSHRRVPVYKIRELLIADACLIQDIEVAVFPGTARQVLGLSALRKATPFAFHSEPPRLVLSHCGLPSLGGSPTNSEVKQARLPPAS